MIKLHFKRPQAADAFISMAEGMWDNCRDDTVMGDAIMEAELALFTAFLEEMAKRPSDFDYTWILDDKFKRMAEDIRDNCADDANNRGINTERDLNEAHEEDREDTCCPFDVSITQA